MGSILRTDHALRPASRRGPGCLQCRPAQALVEEHAGGVAFDQVAHGSENNADQAWALRLVVGWRRRGVVGLAGGHGRAIIDGSDTRQPGCQCKTPKFYRPCPRADNTVFCAGAAIRVPSLPGGPWCSMHATWGGAARGAVLETVVGVGAMFGADTFYQWLATVVLLTAVPCPPRWSGGTACSPRPCCSA